MASVAGPRTVIHWLLARELPFVLAMPRHPGLKLLIHTTTFRALEGDPDVEVAEIRGPLLNLDERLRIAVVRRRVHDARALPQGKVVTNDPNWRYQAIITARAEKPEEIWRLYNGMADCERVFNVAKHALRSGGPPTPLLQHRWPAAVRLRDVAPEGRP